MDNDNTSEISRRRRAAERVFGKPFEHIEAGIVAAKERLETPIDFDPLIADGKLERVSAKKYKLLGTFDELPRHVRDQITGYEPTEDGRMILSFEKNP